MTTVPQAELVGSVQVAGTVAAAMRVPPNDLEAEKALLGCILMDPEAIIAVRDLIAPEDFYAERHAHLYRAAIALADRGNPIDTVTLNAQLESGPGVGRAGGIDYIGELSLFMPTAASVKHYAEIVVAHSLRRRLIQAGGEVTRLGFDAATRVEDAIDTAEQVVFRVGESRHRNADAEHVAPIVRETWALLETRLQKNRLVHGVPTNFAKLDALTQGLQPGELVILAARPSVGKTSLALNIARNAAVLAGKPVVIFSLEMSKQSLAQRLICAEAKVDNYLMRTGQLDSLAYQHIAMALDTLTQADLWIDDTPALAINTLRARARRMKAQYGIDLIVIDYLQLMQGGRQESRVQEVSDISSGLKAIAKELQVPVLALSQLSRESERRENKRPQLSDLRDSGCLAGSTRVFLPDLGSYRPIAELVGLHGFRVLSLNTDTWKLEPQPVERVFPTGHRDTFTLRTQLGRQVCATGNHRFLTTHGWKRLDELAVGEHVALPRVLSSPTETTMPDAELALLAHSIGDGKRIPACVFEQTATSIAVFLRHLWSTDGRIFISSRRRRIPRIHYASSSELLAGDVQSLLLRLGISARMREVSQPGRGRLQYHVILSGAASTAAFLQTVGALRPSAFDHATAFRLWLGATTPNTNRDTVASSVSNLHQFPAMTAAGQTGRQLSAALGTACSGTAAYRSNLSRGRTLRLANAVGSATLASLAASDVYWDQLRSVTPCGADDVYDLTVAGDSHNFVAGDIVVHNSIEQDADVVLFLYREGLHKPEVDKAKTDLIVAKNRNGPTDEIPLVFVATQTAFREPYLESD